MVKCDDVTAAILEQLDYWCQQGTHKRWYGDKAGMTVQDMRDWFGGRVQERPNQLDAGIRTLFAEIAYWARQKKYSGVVQPRGVSHQLPELRRRWLMQLDDIFRDDPHTGRALSARGKRILVPRSQRDDDWG